MLRHSRATALRFAAPTTLAKLLQRLPAHAVEASGLRCDSGARVGRRSSVKWDQVSRVSQRRNARTIRTQPCRTAPHERADQP